MSRAAVLLLLRLPVLLLALAAGAGAHAMSIRELRTLEANEKDGKTYASYYLVGVLEGLREGVEAAQRNGQKPVFCIDGSYEADMPVQLVMSGALKNSFRCTR